MEAAEPAIERENEYPEVCPGSGGLVRDVAWFFHPMLSIGGTLLPLMGTLPFKDQGFLETRERRDTPGKV